MKTRAPAISEAERLSIEEGVRAQRAGRIRSQQDDATYSNVILPRYLEQMDEQLAMGRAESARQAELSKFSTGLARKYDRRMDSLYEDAIAADSESARSLAAGRAISDTDREIAGQRGQTMRGLWRAGVDPTSGKFGAAMASQATNGALAKVMAANTAREAARREGLNMRYQALGMGGGPTSQFLGQAGQFGQGSLAALDAGATGLRSMRSGGSFVGGNGNSGDPAEAAYRQRSMQFAANSANANGVNQGIGAAVGAAAAIYSSSDRRLKTNITRVGTRPDGLGVYEFNYVWGGPRAVGVMADEVAKVYPHAVTRIGGYDAVNYAALGG